MKTLLAIIHETLQSTEFIRYSILMSKDFKMKLHLLFIQDPAKYTMNADTGVSPVYPVQNDIDVSLMEADRKNSLETLEAIIEELKDEITSDVRINLSSETGGMQEIVNLFISENKADIIIVENKKERGFWILDSPDIDLVLKTASPCWIIPSGMEYHPFKKIVYATDYNEADIKTLKELINLTGMFSPEIIALHITDSGDFQKKTMELGYGDMVVEETGYKNITVSSIIDDNDKDMGEHINSFALDNNATLIVLLKENKGFLEKIFKSSATREVIKAAKLPVLVYHE
ncbi:MAG: universal stress protein [Bacteroidales bacterium]